MLVKKGADVNAKDNNGKTALMFAAENEFRPEIVIKIIIILLENGADAKIKPFDGKMAIDFAENNSLLKRWGTEALKKLEAASR